MSVTQDWDAVATLTDDGLNQVLYELFALGLVPMAMTATVDSDADTLTVSYTVDSAEAELVVDLTGIGAAMVVLQDYLNCGSDGRASGGELDSLTSTGMTIELWVKTSTTDAQNLLAIGEGPVLSMAYGQPIVTWGDSYSAHGIAPINDGRWHHIAVVADQDVLYFYVDGLLKSDPNLADAQTAAGTVTIGDGASSKITQVAVWSQALTGTEVQQTMNAWLTGSEDGLVGLWTFADDAVENVVDSTAGTLSGSGEITNLDSSKVPYIIYLYLFDPGAATLNLTYNGTSTQRQLNITRPILLYQGTLDLSGGWQDIYDYLLPTAARATAPTGTTDGELLVGAMTIGAEVPDDDISSTFAGDSDIDVPDGSNALAAVSDYRSLQVAGVAVATELEADDDAFKVSGDPAELTNTEDVNIPESVIEDNLGEKIAGYIQAATLQELDVSYTTDALAVDFAVNIEPEVLPGSLTVTAEMTATPSWDTEKNEGGVALTTSNLSVSYSAGFLVMLFIIAFVVVAIVSIVITVVLTAAFGLIGFIIASIIGSILFIAVFIALIYVLVWKLPSLIEDNMPTNETIDVALPDWLTIAALAANAGIVATGTVEFESSADAAGPLTTAAREVVVGLQIDAFDPTSGPARSVVTITGAGFADATEVAVNDVPAVVFRIANDGVIVAITSPATTAGYITVTTPSDQVTSGDVFTVIDPPTISDFEPQSGSPGDSVTVTGTGFTSDSTVAVGEVQATDVSITDDTTIVFAIPSGASSATIVVTTAAGSAASATALTVESTSPPTISDFDPTCGAVGTEVTIDGTGFSDASVVDFAGTPAEWTPGDDGQITATVASGTASGPITVTNPAGTGQSGTDFDIIPPPTADAIDPSSGEMGDPITITGSGFTDASGSEVTFGTLAAVFTISSETQIIATVPGGAVQCQISVITPGGVATAAELFDALGSAIPTITSFDPELGAAGDTVNVEGQYFTGTAAVDVDGVPAASGGIAVASDTDLQFVVASAMTTGSITVNNSQGTSEPSEDQFDVTDDDAASEQKENTT